MTIKHLVLGSAACALLPLSAFAQLSGFVNSPGSNSTDWTSAVTSAGATIDASMNFDTLPTGALASNAYTGVTFSLTGFSDVTFGSGPGQGNIFSGPLSSGEGLHAASNFLLSSVNNNSLTLTFAAPVFGAGLFVIDNFNIFGTTTSIEAFDSSHTSLGSFSGPNFNFQENNQYFMGVTSTTNDIASLTFTHLGSFTGDQIGVDNIVVARLGSFAPVPEPSTYALSGAALLGVLGFARRLRRKTS